MSSITYVFGMFSATEYLCADQPVHIPNSLPDHKAKDRHQTDDTSKKRRDEETKEKSCPQISASKWFG